MHRKGVVVLASEYEKYISVGADLTSMATIDHKSPDARRSDCRRDDPDERAVCGYRAVPEAGDRGDQWPHLEPGSRAGAALMASVGVWRRATQLIQLAGIQPLPAKCPLSSAIAWRGSSRRSLSGSGSWLDTLRSPRTPTRPRRAAKVRSDQLVERAAATPQKRAGYAQAPELEGGCPLLEPDGVGPRAAALHVPDRDSQIWPVEPA